MGNSKSGALSKELLEDLKLNTKYTEQELSAWYQSFLKECPTGRVTEAQFQKIYSSFFPDADPKAYAQHVFRSFDANSDGTLDFKEFIIALHLTSSGKTIHKLEWAFSLYDVDGNGTINKSEVLQIVTAIFKMINSEDQKSLAEDENTPEKRTDKIWEYFGKKENDKLSEGEFIQGTMENNEILRLIQFEPQKVKEQLKKRNQ
ncbi:recoverin [Callorhinchus milii]|uniref:Recoverin-like protein n=1 Tax=Callorhinchus milii TaxID=7868 RepID=V9L1M6_CALMI|nr:recoverin [Callorhinchus milii]XP_007887036.2 recoverin [Callorhinchus milii]XP_042198382.1 recoverin [Callorhinchus milii]